jgi:DNA primase
LLSRLSSPIERDVYAGKLSSELSVSKDAILSQIEHYASSNQRRQQRLQLSQDVRKMEDSIRKANPDAENNPRASRAEEGLLGLVILNPDYIKVISQKLMPEAMVTNFNRKLYQRLLDRQKQGLLVELAFLASDYDADEMAYISRMVQNARESAHTVEQATEYASVILTEHNIIDLKNPKQIPDDKIKEMLALMREQKK